MAMISGEVRDENGDLAADVVVRAYRRDTGALLVAGLSGDGQEGQDGDLDFTSVSLLLHMEDVDGSTTFSDSSGTTKTVTAYGNAHIESDQSKFGVTSGYFNGVGDYLQVTDHADFDIPGDFTIEFWLYPTSFYKSGGFEQCPFSFGAVMGSPSIRVYETGKLLFYDPSVGSDLTSVALNLNAWNHVAVVRSGTSVKIYMDGVLRRTDTYSTSVAPAEIYIGREKSTYGGYIGYIDELRISKAARYTAAFTPPSAPFLDAIYLEARPLGEYTLTTSYTDEVNVIAIDPAGGDDFNDLILRTTPV